MSSLIPEPDSAEATMTEIIMMAFWNVNYYEHEIRKTHAKKALVFALLQRAGLNTDIAEAKRIIEEIEDDDENYCKTMNEYVAHLVCGAVESIDYYEKALLKANNDLANKKALMHRANLDLPLDEIEAKAKQKLFPKEEQ